MYLRWCLQLLDWHMGARFGWLRSAAKLAFLWYPDWPWTPDPNAGMTGLCTMPPFSCAEDWIQGCLNTSKYCTSSVTPPAWVLGVGCLDASSLCSLGQFSLAVVKYTLSKNSSLTSKYALPTSLVYSFPLGSSLHIPTHISQHCPL